MATLVSAIRVAATGDVGVGPARVKNVHVVTSAGVGRVTITDGNGGATLIDADFLASDCASLSLPDDGVRFATGMFVTALTNVVSITVVYS